MATITHKQGDTLDWTVTLEEDRAVVDLTGWSIRAHIRTGDTLVGALTVVLTDAVNGVFSLVATATQTDSWAAGTHNVDIEFTDDTGDVFSTNTFQLTIVEDVSHD